ncbi:sensor histidine kinase [Nocardia sp. NPDC051900]|uniref:sensor histidine kinase n=1 Tax=Nocardia sp. NPDC051900 TaxID=3364326 RepID=UPI003790BA7A
MFHFTPGIRARILSIALIPSVVLLAVGAAGAAILVTQGVRDKNFADENVRSAPAIIDLTSLIQNEFRLTLLRVSGKPIAPNDLVDARARVDEQIKVNIGQLADMSSMRPGTVDGSSSEVADAYKHIVQLRGRVDTGMSSIDEVYGLYMQVARYGSTIMDGIAKAARDVSNAASAITSTRLFSAVLTAGMAHSMAAAAADTEGLAPAYWRESVRQIDIYHNELANLAPQLAPSAKRMLDDLTGSQLWQQSTAIEEAIISDGARARDDQRRTASTAALQGTASTAALQVDLDAWHVAFTGVEAKLLEVWRTNFAATHQVASDIADRTVRNSIAGGVAAVAIAFGILLVSVGMSNRLTRRLKRLRGETLAMADKQLPDIMTRIGNGESVDVESEVVRLDFGRDEIGQVADAFNRSQLAAVSAAVTEAKTRGAVNAVFLNIAHRSQLMMHRQLEILDTAESRQEDPELLSVLFQLDHLATRERRNAENLIILGGERPGRRWRNPVPLIEIVRSAIAETQDYQRVRSSRVPDVRVIGTVVADVIHLLAELIDNATSFSPSGSRVEASGTIVGKGAVIEVVDQGLGMPGAELDRANEMLRNPPDFGVLHLSSDSRLGLLVVAALAGRSNIKVRLAESDYGGVRAVVLIPQHLLDTELVQPGSGDEGAGLSDSAEQFGSQLNGWTPQVSSSRSVELLESSADLARRTGDVPETPGWPGDSEFGPVAAEGRPPLPRRRRQEHLAPELAQPTSSASSGRSTPIGSRSPEQARDLFTAIEAGTRQGRHAQS